MKLEKNKDKVAEYFSIKSDEFYYQIENIHLRLFSIDLKDRKCSYKIWDLTWIPCNHVIATIWVKKDELEKYVHECYTVGQYMKSYYPYILPINISEQWSKNVVEPPLPPIFKARPGNQEN